MKKICVKCGKEFEAHKPHLDKTLCDECAAKSANKTIIRDRICVDCGVHFVGYPKSLRCDKCRVIRRRETNRACAERRKRGENRPLGSVDHCAICGKEYIVNSGMQRYCPDCAPEAIKESGRRLAKKWASEHFDYEKRQEDREKSKAEIPCVICGKMFVPHSPTVTCSPECSAELSKRNTIEWEKAHREERNAYHRQKAAEKESAMSKEEYTEYHEKKNAKARENYAKRLAAMTDEELAAYRRKKSEQYKARLEKGKGEDGNVEHGQTTV